MLNITIYHNPRWSKSRESVKILSETNYNFTIKEYLKTGLNKIELVNISKYLKLKPKDFIRTSEKDFKQLNLTIEEINNDDFLIKKIIEFPKILQRPIIIKNQRAIIGRPPESILEIL